VIWTPGTSAVSAVDPMPLMSQVVISSTPADAGTAAMAIKKKRKATTVISLFWIFIKHLLDFAFQQYKNKPEN
jgi:ribulose 1,5-bisphosphate synthetase/thiazole synthase